MDNKALATLLFPETTLLPQDMENKKDDPVTKVLDKATEAIKAAQDKAKEKDLRTSQMVSSISESKIQTTSVKLRALLILSLMQWHTSV